MKLSFDITLLDVQQVNRCETKPVNLFFNVSSYVFKATSG